MHLYILFLKITTFITFVVTAQLGMSFHFYTHVPIMLHLLQQYKAMYSMLATR